MAEQQRDTRGGVVDERGVLITAEGRARMREKMDEVANRWTPEEREERRAALGARIDGAINERRAERETDPIGYWHARGEEAAHEAVRRERYLPAEALEVYRAAFDATLLSERERVDQGGSEADRQSG